MDWANKLAPHYSDFNVSKRILLSGHSHQAWPNVAKQGVLDCYQDAAKHVDEKWGAAFEKADQVRDFYRGLMGEPQAQIALGQSTHELILRFLSDLDSFKSPTNKPTKIITTNGEFHSMRRQLDRLSELNIEVEVVDAFPTETLAARIIEKLDAHTSAVIVSAVFFATSEIFHDVSKVALAAKSLNVPCLVDAYHALNVVPFNLVQWQLESAFIVGGGYKYCQAGEGNCFMRIPANYHGEPIITGWYAEFELLDQAPNKVSYGKGQSAFAGSTYDPTSHYRAAAVFEFFKQQGLTDTVLNDINKLQIATLWNGIAAMNLPEEVLALPKHGIENNAGFLSLTTPKASDWVSALNDRGILTDSRGDQLRFGPAPYLSNNQLSQALNAIEDIAVKLK